MIYDKQEPKKDYAQDFFTTFARANRYLSYIAFLSKALTHGILKCVCVFFKEKLAPKSNFY